MGINARNTFASRRDTLKRNQFGGVLGGPIAKNKTFLFGSWQGTRQNSGASTIVERIQAGIQAGQCACDIRNPQGHCCLGNVRDLIERLSDPLPNNEALDV